MLQNASRDVDKLRQQLTKEKEKQEAIQIVVGQNLLLVAVESCSSLTTMSPFALETTRMLDERFFSGMAVNILANVGLSIGALIGGRQLINIIIIIIRRGGGGLLW
jgi:fluoride ion exporter CrcB/FEX